MNTRRAPQCRRLRTRLALAATLIPLSLLQTQAASPHEAAFYTLWKQHAADPSAHGELITACTSFAAAATGDTLVTTAQQIQAWHLLKLGRHAEAAALLTGTLERDRDALDKAASEIARAWLTRIDRDPITEALQQVYRQNIAYPESLQALPAEVLNTLPQTDRWDNPWRYSPTGFDHLKGFPGQRYALHSRTLGHSSDLTYALRLPYAGDIALTPLRRKPSDGVHKIIIEFADARDRKTTLSPGTRHGDIVLAYLGQNVILLADPNHWKVVPLPGR